MSRKPDARTRKETAQDPRKEQEDGAALAPLLLLPLRLEYRLIKEGAQLRRLTHEVDFEEVVSAREKIAATAVTDPETAEKMRQKLSATIAKSGGGSGSVQPFEARRDELWLRWYFDDNFAHGQVPEISAEETRLLAELKDVLRQRKVPDPSIDAHRAAWAALAAVSGPARALYLLRGGSPDENGDARLGRFTLLPRKVAVFGLSGGKISPIGTGASIPANPKGGAGPVSAAPGAVGDLTWLSSFEIATREGMGLRLTDPDAIEQAMAAEWLVAVGMATPEAEAGVEEMHSLFETALATGDFGFVPEDSATNNAPGAPLNLRPDRQEALLYLDSAAGLENGLYQTAPRDMPAPRLARALGLGETTLHGAPHGADEAGINAAAMMHVIGPALLDGALAAADMFNGLSEAEVVAAIARTLLPGGPLSAMRFGDAAYGALPIAPKTGITIKGEANTAIATLAQVFSVLLERPLAEASEDVTVVLQPEDPDGPEKLSLILSSERVSQRLEAGTENQEDTEPVSCPLVFGKGADFQPLQYLQLILDKPQADLPDPADRNKTWPLLYRLARLSLSSITVLDLSRRLGALTGSGNLQRVQGGFVDGLPRAQRDELRALIKVPLGGFSAAALSDIRALHRPHILKGGAAFRAALEQLLKLAKDPDGQARLETLMMGVIDIFQNRPDAWLAARDWMALEANREESKSEGLFGGYFGFQRGPGSEAVAPGPGGYLQAPSQPQAVTAAILRSAYMRNGDEDGFAINLRSARVRHALDLLDFLRRGVDLPTALGLRAERWLRAEEAHHVLADLARDYPLHDVNDPDRAAHSRGLDGLAFASAEDPGGAELSRLHAELNTELDALADLVLAEAVHQRALGAADRANAWLQVLSGGSIPGRPEFLRTERLGHVSDYRVTLALPGGVDDDFAKSVRAIAEPGGAGFLAELVPDWAQQVVEVQAEMVDSGKPLFVQAYQLAQDLNVTPADAAYLGAEPLLRRIKRHALANALRDPESAFHIAGLLAEGAQSDLAALPLQWTVTLNGQPLGESPVLATLDQGAALLRRAPALTPGDLAAAADPDHPLEPEQEALSLQATTAELADRLRGVDEWMQSEKKNIAKRRSAAFGQLARRHIAERLNWGQNKRADAAVARAFAAYGLSVAHAQDWGDRLPLFAALPAAALTAFDAAEAEAVAFETRLEARHGALVAYRANRVEPDPDAPVAQLRALRDADGAALTAALGDKAPAVFPPVGRNAATTPVLDAEQSVSAGLAPWPRFRKPLATAQALVEGMSGYRLHPVAKTATRNDAGALQRPEADAPRSYHHGRFIGPRDRLTGSTIAGLVIDEWTEKRPARQQVSGVAINHDAPQAEAPNCLLICVPDKEIQQTGWTPETAAGLVAMAIDRMRLRAYSSETTPLTDTIPPGANRVSYRVRKGKERPRIPVRKFPGTRAEWFNLRARFLTLAQKDDDPGPFGDGLNISRPMGPIRRRL